MGSQLPLLSFGWANTVASVERRLLEAYTKHGLDGRAVLSDEDAIRAIGEDMERTSVSSGTCDPFVVPTSAFAVIDPDQVNEDLTLTFDSDDEDSDVPSDWCGDADSDYDDGY